MHNALLVGLSTVNHEVYCIFSFVIYVYDRKINKYANNMSLSSKTHSLSTFLKIVLVTPPSSLPPQSAFTSAPLSLSTLLSFR